MFQGFFPVVFFTANGVLRFQWEKQIQSNNKVLSRKPSNIKVIQILFFIHVTPQEKIITRLWWSLCSLALVSKHFKVCIYLNKVTLEQWFLTGSIMPPPCAPPWEHVAMTVLVITTKGVLLVEKEQRTGMLLNIMQCTEHPVTSHNKEWSSPDNNTKDKISDQLPQARSTTYPILQMMKWPRMPRDWL